MHSWLNIDTLLSSDDSQPHRIQSKKPQQRWGQACVVAHNKIYIIGGYEGKI